MKTGMRRLVDQVLVADEPCLGAVFCTYTFNPTYFEDHVLRALLKLGGDPDEDGARYHGEARTVLRETPVACFIDAGVRASGRRLPYDLHLIHKRTFHPKVILVLYDKEARLAVGSGNTTRPGFEQNAELFFTRALRYDDPSDAAVLRGVDSFLASCDELAAGGGSQLGLIRETLAARLTKTSGTAVDVAFVHTFASNGLSWLADALPPDATVTRVGVLAPFFERDDFEASDEQHGLASVLAEILALRPGPAAELDLGVPWEDAPLAPPSASGVPALVAGLWARRLRVTVDDEDVERIDYLLIDSVTAKRVAVRDSAGRAQRLERETLEAEAADRRFWPVPTPTVHAPGTILGRIAKSHPVRLWLHPTAQLLPSGRPEVRPLHAKLFLVTVQHGSATSTYAVVGSANASRAAMMKTVAEGGNVEAGVVVRFEGEVRLRDLLPTLVLGDLQGVRFEERSAPPVETDLSAWIDDVVHHADARTLTVAWADEGPAPLGAWKLRYLDRMLATGNGPDAKPLVVADFDLAATSAEIELEAAGRRWLIPIRVADLAMLPLHPGLVGLSIRELLALLGRRIGTERLATLRDQRGTNGVATVLDAVFGEGFGPTDVFKAWWGLREDLTVAPTLAAFRFRLLGPTGAQAVWERLREVPDDQLSRDEVWVYGCELVRELGRVEIPPGPDQPARSTALADLISSVRTDLQRLAPTGAGKAWLDAVQRFYAQTEAS